MNPHQRLAKAFDLELPDRPPIMGGWLAAPRHIQRFTGCSEEDYWADPTGWGIRAVVSTRFADIFHNNAVKNGLLLVLVGVEAQGKLFELTAQDPSARVTIDLESQSLVFPDGSSVQFPIDPFDKRCLLEGVDQLGYLFTYADQIDAYEKAHGIA